MLFSRDSTAGEGAFSTPVHQRISNVKTAIASAGHLSKLQTWSDKCDWQPFTKTLALTRKPLAPVYYHSTRPHAEFIKLLPPICFRNGCPFRYLASVPRQLLGLTNRTATPQPLI
jgi:hypothetical protein